MDCADEELRKEEEAEEEEDGEKNYFKACVTTYKLKQYNHVNTADADTSATPRRTTSQNRVMNVILWDSQKMC